MTKDNSTLDSRLRFEMLQGLAGSAWRDFDSRRAFEWKIAISLWTALAAFLATVLTGRIDLPPIVTIPVVAGAAAVLLVMHVVFVRGIARANKINRQKQFFYEDQMNRMLNLSLPEEIDKLVERAKRSHGKLWNWSHSFQLLVTAMLLIICVIATAAVDG